LKDSYIHGVQDKGIWAKFDYLLGNRAFCCYSFSNMITICLNIVLK
jgi:hypothetical protein